MNKTCVSSILIIILLAALAWTVTGCTDLEPYSPPPQPAQPQQQKPPVEKTPLKATSEDKAILAIYEHLLSLAEGHKAKAYLANFYTVSDNWVAEKELLKDGTSIWHIVVDMTDVEEWKERPYWQQASWLILQDGKVIPSNRFQANALRIEADLQELSLPPEEEPAAESEKETLKE